MEEGKGRESGKAGCGEGGGGEEGNKDIEAEEGMKENIKTKRKDKDKACSK